MNTKVKICGIRNLEQARAAYRFGADFLGFNFIPTSKRYISVDEAEAIINQFPKETKMVGVFQSIDLKSIITISERLKLDFAQIHGELSKKFSELPSHVGVIRAFNLEKGFEPYKVIEQIRKSDIDFPLLDREIQGEGEPLNLLKVQEVAKHFTIFLSGGLTVDTVSGAVQLVNPFAVDVASGIETDGEIDFEKMRMFINRAKQI